MNDWVCTRCLVVVPQADSRCPHCGVRRVDVSPPDSVAGGADLPRSYVVTYEGSSRDDAEYQAELDERRRALDGYVATGQRWVQEGWNADNIGRVLSGLFVWSGMWRQHRDRAYRSILFGPPAVLEVTYSLEGEAFDEK